MTGREGVEPGQVWVSKRAGGPRGRSVDPDGTFGGDPFVRVDYLSSTRRDQLSLSTLHRKYRPASEGNTP